MARGPTTDEQELPAYPIRAYQLIPDPNQPTVVALAIETDQGHSLFLATRQILEDLGKDLLERAAKMPAKPGGVHAPLLVMNGGDDKFVPADSIAEFQNEMRMAGADWQFVNFGGAVHCFAEPDEHGSVPGCQFHEPSYRRSVKMMHGFFDEVFARRN